jgi:hypothetical protein
VTGWLWVPLVLPLVLMAALLVLDAFERVCGTLGQGPEGP